MDKKFQYHNASYYAEQVRAAELMADKESEHDTMYGIVRDIVAEAIVALRNGETCAARDIARNVQTILRERAGKPIEYMGEGNEWKRILTDAGEPILYKSPAEWVKRPSAYSFVKKEILNRELDDLMGFGGF